jgi:hypothetical protein
MVAPILNNNGTSKAELIDQRAHAYSALRDAIEAVKGMAPNGRDYIGDPERFTAAREQFRGMLATLENMREEILLDTKAIQRQGRS